MFPSSNLIFVREVLLFSVKISNPLYKESVSIKLFNVESMDIFHLATLEFSDLITIEFQFISVPPPLAENS